MPVKKAKQASSAIIGTHKNRFKGNIKYSEFWRCLKYKKSDPEEKRFPQSERFFYACYPSECKSPHALPLPSRLR